MARVLSGLSALVVVLAVSAPVQAAKKTVKVAPKRQAASDEAAPVSIASNSAEMDETSGPRFQLRPTFTYTFMNPKKVNSELSSFATANAVNSTYKIGGAPTFGVAAEYGVIAELLYVGARMEYLTSSTDAVKVSGNGGSVTLQDSVTAMPLYLTATLNWEAVPRFSVGVTGGAGLPIMYRAAREVSGSTINGVKNGQPTYSATPITAMGLAYGAFNLNRRIALRLEGGYRLMASSQMKLTENYGTLKEGDLLQDSSKANLEVDTSSFFTGLALTIEI